MPPLPSNPQASNSNGSKTVAILVGVAIFESIAGIGICLFLCYYLRKRKKEKASFDGSFSVQLLCARPQTISL